MKLLLSIIAISIFSSGCATVKSSGSSSASNFESTNTKGLSADKIRKDLTRVGYNSLLGESVGAFPITGAYIEAWAKEEGAKNLDSVAQVEKNIADKKALLLNGKSCFGVSVNSSRGIDGAMFKNWRAKVEQPEGNLKEAVLTNVKGVESVPSHITSGPGAALWQNDSFVCVDNVLNYKMDFSLYMIQQLGSEKPIKLSWKASAK